MNRRKEIFQIIKQNPGITFRQLVREVGTGIGDVQHHLHILEEEGLVVSRRLGKRRYIFPSSFERDWEKIMIALSTKTRRKILLNLSNGPKTQSELAREVGVTQPTISYHLKFLLKLGVVEEKREGRGTVYTLSLDPEMIKRILSEYEDGIIGRLSEGLIELLNALVMNDDE